VLVEAVPLHDHPLRPLDRRAALERPLELIDLLTQRGGVAVPAQRDLDRRLQRLGGDRVDVGGDPPLGRAGDEAEVVRGGLGDHGSGGVFDGLGDQGERVLLVAVHHDDRQLRVLAGAALDRLLHGHHVGRDRVSQIAEDRREAVERAPVLVGDEDPQPPVRGSAVASAWALTSSPGR